MRLGTQCLICAKSWTPWLRKSICTYRLPRCARQASNSLQAVDVTGSVKKAAGRWLSRDSSIQRLRTTRPSLVEQLGNDMVDAEQKARAQGIRKVVTSFTFVCTLYFLSDVMPQLTIFCKTLQAVDVGVDGVMAAYRTTREILMGYKKDISKLPFTRRFVSALALGRVPNLDLPVSREDDEEAYRVCIAKESPRGTSKCVSHSWGT